MSDNNNPAGIGTGSSELEDDGLEAFLADSDDENNGTEEELDASAEQDADADEEPGDEDGDQDDPGDENDARVKLADGTEVTIKELIDGYSRQSDYTRKTQELVGLRADLDAKTARISEQSTVLEQHQQQLATAFEDVVGILAARMPPEPDPRLAQTDPTRYVQERALYDHALREMQGVVAQRDQRQRAIAEQQQQVEAQHIAVEAQKIEAAFPHIKGAPEKAKAFWDSAMNVGRELGFSDAELGAARDARFIIGLGRMAAIAARDKARTELPKQLQKRPGAAPSPVRQQAGTSGAKDLRAFRQSGNVSSASKALDGGAFDHLL